MMQTCHQRISPALLRAGIARRPLSTSTTPIPTHHQPFDQVDIEHFRHVAFAPQKPLILRAPNSSLVRLPALTKWFSNSPLAPGNKLLSLDTSVNLMSSWFPYELAYSCRTTTIDPTHGTTNVEAIDRFCKWCQSPNSTHQRSTVAKVIEDAISDASAQPSGVARFDAPLILLQAALQFNEIHHNFPLRSLYVAQALLNDYPHLKADVPTPLIVSTAGKGDVYGASVWLGLEGTYTPWHRDPNPNLFVQLCSSKRVRMLPPKAGEEVFRHVLTTLGKQSSSRIRGQEMLGGEEGEALNEAVWGDNTSPAGIYEAEVYPGDALFVPLGWWHSIKSSFDDGRLNGSVNWWFR